MKHVRDILTIKGTSVDCVPGEENVVTAARLMNDQRIGALVVTQDGRMVGIFTERDILMRIVAAGRDPNTTIIQEVMSAPCVIVSPEDSLAQCKAIMTQKRIRHLPVVANDDLIGIVSTGDVLASENHELETTIKYLNEYIYG